MIRLWYQYLNLKPSLLMPSSIWKGLDERKPEEVGLGKKVKWEATVADSKNILLLIVLLPPELYFGRNMLRKENLTLNFKEWKNFSQKTATCVPSMPKSDFKLKSIDYLPLIHHLALSLDILGGGGGGRRRGIHCMCMCYIFHYRKSVCTLIPTTCWQVKCPYNNNITI